MKVNDILEASETPHKHIIWVDDLRNPGPALEGKCDIARTYDEAIQMLSKHMYTDMYLDHDLGDFSGEGGRERTGYDVLMWLVQRKHDGEHVPTNFHILTANPVGRQKFEGVINRYLRS
jgi:hypothetical protein